MKLPLFSDTVKKLIDSAQVVSFDIFDTLLIRPYLCPRDLFRHMEYSLSVPGFATKRLVAEQQAHVRHPDMEDITYDMIYTEIDAEFRDMKQRELDWEKLVLRANPEIKAVYDYAKEAGKKIVIISDMYLPTDFIASVLRQNGFDGWDRLYVSGDLALRKKTGSLYQRILDDLQVPAGSILHIGDNKLGDGEIPKRYGIQSILYTPVMTQYTTSAKRIGKFLQAAGSGLDVSVMMGLLSYRWQVLRCGGKNPNYWENLGYDTIGPLAFGFAQFIQDQAIENNLKQLLFVARDGYTLQNVFRVLNGDIRTAYVYGNRKLSLICGLNYRENNPEYAAQTIVDWYAAHFPQIADLVAKNPKKTPTELLDTHFDLFEKYAKTCRSDYNRLLQGLSLQISDPIGIVDTLSTYLSAQAFLESVIGKPLYGLYWGTLKPKADTPDISGKYTHADWAHTGMPADEPLIRQNPNHFTKNWNFIEYTLCSPEPPIDSVGKDGIVYEVPTKAEQERIDNHPFIDRGAVAFARDIKDRFGDKLITLEFKTVIKWINAFIDWPDSADMAVWTGKSLSAQLSGVPTDFPIFIQKVAKKDYLFHPRRIKTLLSRQNWRTSFQDWYLKNWWIYRNDSPFHKEKRFFGIPLYSSDIKKGKQVRKGLFGLIKTKTRNGIQIKKILFGLFKIKKAPHSKKFYLCGIKLWGHRTKPIIDFSPVITTIIETQQQLQQEIKHLLRDVNRLNQINNSTLMMHQETFLPFRNTLSEQSIVIVASGPTASFYQPMKGVKHLAVNRSFLLKDIDFDYLFIQDFSGPTSAYIDAADAYKPDTCIKFYGLTEEWGTLDRVIPQTHALKAHAHRYRTDWVPIPDFKPKFTYDLATQPLCCYGTIVFPALQFACWTNVSRIYLVGCDTTNAGYFNSQQRNTELPIELLKNAYREFKDFCHAYYPQIEIISVNPAGLRGIFRDVYTRSYLNKHPEIDETTVEILSDEI